FLIHCLAFELLDMKRLFCACAQANESAVRLNTFLGYQEIGICPLALKTPHGSYNLIDFEMLPEHFAKQKEDIEQSLYKGRSIPQFLTAHDDLKDSLILK
ncbi:MAG: hypothetical protein KC618_04950, partial [Candidatus Omnitrophica bacterium]|nr:hypothetical protein [Candidatus Omnitrophota bacterium]